ncbi:MAG: hypothetical protein IJP54_04390 [Synergistaceae bacterium]|nr:hypothetical protein [Synergistaceae bacterium]
MEDTAAKQTPNTEPFFARLKAKLKSYKLIYYPAHYILWPIKRFKPFMRWQLYKHTVKFNTNGLNRTRTPPPQNHRLTDQLPRKDEIRPLRDSFPPEPDHEARQNHTLAGRAAVS